MYRDDAANELQPAYNGGNSIFMPDVGSIPHQQNRYWHSFFKGEPIKNEYIKSEGKKGMKKIVGIMVVLLISVSLVACGSGSGKGSNKKITLEVALWSERVNDALTASIQKFNEQYPNVEVNVTISPFGEYWTKLRTSLGGGSGPDVFWMNGPNFHQYTTSGLIQNLQPYIDKDEDYSIVNYYDTLKKLYSYDGDLYAAPYFFDSVGLFYNKQLFDEADVSYPDETWTWETLEQAGKKLSNKEEGIYGYAAHTVISQEGYYNIIHQAGGYIISEDRTKSGFDLPETKEAFHFLQRLIDEGISPTTQSQIETHPRDMFISGKIAMLPAVSTNSSLLYEALGDQLGVAPLPKGKQAASIIHGIAWAMNSKTKHEDVAWELIKALTNDEGNRIIAESGYTMPANKQLAPLWTESIPSLELQIFIDAQQYGAVYPISKETAAWQSIETKEIQSALLEGRSIDEALDKVAAEMNKILQEENQ